MSKLEEEDIELLATNKQLKILSDFFLSFYLGSQGNRRGAGSNFHSLKEYNPQSDDSKNIDCTSLAKDQKLHSKQFFEDKIVEPFLIVDSSGSMKTKEDKINSLIYFFKKVFEYTQTSCKSLRVLAGDAELQQDLELKLFKNYSVKEFLAQTKLNYGKQGDLAKLIQSASTKFRRRNFVIVISDFIDSEAAFKELSLLSHKHILLAVHLHSSLESEIPQSGTFYAKDPETGATKIIDFSSQDFRNNYAKIVELKRTHVQKALLELGSNCLSWQFSTEQSLASNIKSFMSINSL
ncbi:MAG: DUF58 domain-containing protein [Candidatus Caenarcaniphilales bacterium]|nr:DUF58 domain-containing protein [Candidatus Caenarcaniphilales bacterium]